MSKTWNDSVWPILHVGFGLLIAVFLANAMFGIVDGSGGNIAYVPNDSGLIPSGNIQEGDIYPCDEKYQQDGCRNSLTPFAGTNGSLSMPMGFYWDGILLMLLATIGLAASLFLHLVRVPGWRARAKAMREFADDKADAAESATLKAKLMRSQETNQAMRNTTSTKRLLMMTQTKMKTRKKMTVMMMKMEKKMPLTSAPTLA